MAKVDELEELQLRIDRIEKTIYDIKVVAYKGRRCAPILACYFDSITRGSTRVSADLEGIQHVLRSLIETNCDGVDVSNFTKAFF